MSNIKLKDHNWATDGIYDTNQSKTQKTINSDVNTKIGQATLQTTSQNLSGATNELKGRADTLDSNVSALQGAISSLNTQTNSISWTPTSGDTLLAFILANCVVTKLPFSFVKVGSVTVSDAPTDYQSFEFAGIVFGSNDRLVVHVHPYASSPKGFFERTIYINNWRSSSWVEYISTTELRAEDDSYWVTLVNDTTGQVFIWRQGKIVSIVLRNYKLQAGAQYTIATLDTKYRPPGYQIMPLINFIQGAVGYMYVGATGEVIMNNQAGAVSQVDGMFTYLVV